MNYRVVIVDDEETIRKLLNSKLEREGFRVTACSNAEEAEVAFEKGPEIGVMVTDLKMPGKDGFQLMKALRQKYPLLRTIVITGHGEKEVAIQALKNGAADYLEKPFDMEELGHSVKRAMREYELDSDKQNKIDRLEVRVSRVEGKTEDQAWYVSRSSSMEKVNDWLSVLRRESMRGEAEEPSVLILGDSGTGKEGIVRMIHAGSRGGKGPWVAVNCANFNEQLLESELFGHEKDAFTGATSMKRGLFEIAKNGTLFLDEIGEIDIKLQARILRVIQEKVCRRVGGTSDYDVDVRIVAATNRNLEQRTQDGSFREDLYHRLSQVVIELPALKERKDDIVPMAKEFFNRAYSVRGKHFEGFTPDAEHALENYNWPGNVRELLNIVERTALIWQGRGPVSGDHLNLPSVNDMPADQQFDGFGSDKSPYSTPKQSGLDGYMGLKRKWCDAFEKEYLVAALGRHGGNVSAAAREAKIDRSNFLRLLRRHGVRAQEFRKAA